MWDHYKDFYIQIHPLLTEVLTKALMQFTHKWRSLSVPSTSDRLYSSGLLCMLKFDERADIEKGSRDPLKAPRRLHGQTQCMKEPSRELQCTSSLCNSVNVCLNILNFHGCTVYIVDSVYVLPRSNSTSIGLQLSLVCMYIQLWQSTVHLSSWLVHIRPFLQFGQQVAKMYLALSDKVQKPSPHTLSDSQLWLHLESVLHVLHQDLQSLALLAQELEDPGKTIGTKWGSQALQGPDKLNITPSSSCFLQGGSKVQHNADIDSVRGHTCCTVCV